MQELIDSLNKLRELLDQAEKRLEAGNAAAIAEAAIAGGIVGGSGWPNRTAEYLDTLDKQGLDAWADDMEATATSLTWNE